MKAFGVWLFFQLLLFTSICFGGETPSRDPESAGQLVAKLTAQISVYTHLIERIEKLETNIRGFEWAGDLHGISVQSTNPKIVSAQPGTWVDVPIAKENSLGSQKIGDFIETYNDTAFFLKRAILSGPTAGDLSLIFAYTRLLDAATNILPGLPEDSEIRALSDLGIFAIYRPDVESGVLSFDQEWFDRVISQNLKAVQIFFDGNAEGASQGFAGYFIGELDLLIDPVVGILTTNRRRLEMEILDIAEHVNSGLGGK